MHKLLCADEAARYLGISRRTLDHLRATGRGPKYIKLAPKNGKIYYKPADLDRFLADSTFDPAEAVEA